MSTCKTLQSEEGLNVVLVSMSWFWYCAVVMQGVTIGGNGNEMHKGNTPILFFATYMNEFIIILNRKAFYFNAMQS